MDRLASMEAFLRVAETGSFSQAAHRLGVSKSLVSRQVAALEETLGARLLNRTTRSLTPTEAGRAYREQVARILAEIDEANHSVSQLQTAPRGRLRVSAPMSFGTLHLAATLPDFLMQFPDIEIELSLNDRFVDLVEEGFDLAIRIGHLTDSSMVARRVAAAHRAVCASPQYLAAHGIPAGPEALKDHCCLCYTNLSPSEEWRFLGKDGGVSAVEVRGKLRANNGDVLREAAIAGLGVVNLPTFIVGGDLRAGRLMPILSDFLPQEAAIYAVYPHPRLLSPKVRAFVDFLVERFSQADWDRPT